MNKLKLYYCFDPFCGWCYAFGQILLKIEKEYRNDILIEVLCGGMLVGDNIPNSKKLKDYIIKTIPQVEERADVKFGKEFLSILDDESYQPHSMPPSKSITVYKSLNDFNSLSYAHDIQKAYFLKGEDIQSPHYFTSLAVKHGFNPNQFMERWEHPDYETKTEKEFEFVKNMGIKSFPCVIGKAGNELQLLSRGFIDYENLKSTLDSWITQTKSLLN